MPRFDTLADQAARIDASARGRTSRRMANRSTFNSRFMWLLVAVVWTAAAAILAVGLARQG